MLRKLRSVLLGLCLLCPLPALGAEMSFGIYLKSANPDTHTCLEHMLLTFDKSARSRSWEPLRQQLVPLVQAIRKRGDGERLVEDLIERLTQDGYGQEDLSLDGDGAVEAVHGYWRAYFLFGSPGPQVSAILVRFFGELSADIDVRGVLTGDDDPWEAFYRFENGRAVGKYYELFTDSKQDQKTLLTGTYAWWHRGLPNTIREGFLNDRQYAQEPE